MSALFHTGSSKIYLPWKFSKFIDAGRPDRIKPEDTHPVRRGLIDNASIGASVKRFTIPGLATWNDIQVVIMPQKAAPVVGLGKIFDSYRAVISYRNQTTTFELEPGVP